VSQQLPPGRLSVYQQPSDSGLTLLKNLSDHRVRSSATVTVGHAQNLSVLGTANPFWTQKKSQAHMFDAWTFRNVRQRTEGPRS
jgi:hypothetical protein